MNMEETILALKIKDNNHENLEIRVNGGNEENVTKLIFDHINSIFLPR
jgi:hypothetical protein